MKVVDERDGQRDEVSVDVQVDEPTRNPLFLTLWIYPTPTSGRGRVRINHPAAAREMYSLKLFDLQGIEVLDLSHQLPAQSSSEQLEFEIELGSVPSGVYFLQLTTEVGRRSVKVLVTTR